MGSLCASAWDIAGRPAKGEGLSAPQFRESSFTMSVNNANGLAQVGTEATADCPRPTNAEEGETEGETPYLNDPLLSSSHPTLNSLPPFLLALLDDVVYPKRTGFLPLTSHNLTKVNKVEHVKGRLGVHNHSCKFLLQVAQVSLPVN